MNPFEKYTKTMIDIAMRPVIVDCVQRMHEIVNHNIENIAKISHAANIPTESVVEYLKTHSFDSERLYTIVKTIRRLPTPEDLRTIQFMGISNFIKYARPLL